MSAPAANWWQKVAELPSSRRHFRRRSTQLEVGEEELERVAASNKCCRHHLLQQSLDRFFPLNLMQIGAGHQQRELDNDKLGDSSRVSSNECCRLHDHMTPPLASDQDSDIQSTKDLISSSSSNNTINNNKTQTNMTQRDQQQVINPLESGHHHGRHRRQQHCKATSLIYNPAQTHLCSIPKGQFIAKTQRQAPSQQSRLLMTPSKCTNETRLKTLLLVTVLSIIVLCQSISVKQVSCQLFNSEPPPQQGSLGVESRASGGNGLVGQQPNLRGIPNSNTALEQLVSFLSSINNQQQANQANGNQRRSPAIQPLPLGVMGNQRQLGQPQPVSSTPVNPFVAAVNFQPTRRQQAPTGVQFPQSPQQQPPQNPFNQQGPTSSSPSPPPLTLNRIANQFNGQQQQPQQQPNLNMGQQAGAGRFTNSQQLPAGGAGNPFSNSQSRLLIPQRNFNRPQANNGNNNLFGQPLRSPLMPPPTGSPSTGNQPQQQQPQQQQQPPRPITGFAPSGPPPGSASNNAISVVQSPANAIGQQHSPAMQMLTPFEMPLLSSTSNRSITSAATTTTTTAATTTTTGDTTTNRQPQTTTAAATTTTSTTTTTSARPPSPDESATTLTSVSSSPSEQPNQTSAGTTSTSSSSESSSDSATAATSTTTTTDSNWNPVQMQANRTRPFGSTSLAPSPDIVTVPPGYNPDQPAGPQSYDISVSAQMGGGSQASGSQPIESSSSLSSSSSAAEATPSLASQPSVLVAAAPTETTTIIWSSETQASTSSSSTGLQTQLGQPTRTASLSIQPTRLPPTAGSQQQQQQTPPTTTPGPQTPSRIRDVMMQNDEPQANEGIVYGKAAGREAKPKSPELQQQQQSGRPFIQNAQLDTQVRPYSAGSQPLLKSNHGSTLPFKPSRPLNSNGNSGPSSGNGSGMSVGSGFSIVAAGNQTMPTGDIQDYVANAPPPIVSLGQAQQPAAGNSEPTISAQGGPDPATFDLAPDASNTRQAQETPAEVGGVVQTASSTGAPPTRLRRPTFKPKPAVPPIRIDSCIVGDDSSCDQSHNERCVTEYGISSCHCKPGYARLSQLRGFCSPVSLLQFNMKIDRLSDDRKLAFNASLENPNSEEYQYLEFETIQALASAIQQTALAKQFMGARLNKFYERKNKVWANVSLSLELNNVTRSEARIQQLAQQELGKLVQQKQRQPLGESTIVLDGSRESLSKLVDVNECASKELNDCSKHATCSNEFGGYSCQCLAGYEDKSQLAALTANSGPQQQQQSDEEKQAQRAKQGRVCMGCSAAYCSNRGECSIVEGKKQCKCRANFIGARCDIDSEVLAVAIGGSLVGLIILIVTFWCLFVFNRRWRREQQKMDAMSATSGLTYNYANSNNNSTNSLMAPLGTIASRNSQNPGGVVSGRSANGGAYTMGQRFTMGSSSGLTSRHYHADQQAIIGSSGSSGSSAASQPIACNPYVAAGYPYDEGLLIAPASTGSSEQTSPSANSYRGIMGASNSNHSAAMLAAAVNNAYTLSGHHHHHAHHNHHHHQHLLQQQQHQHQLAAHHMHHHHHHNGGGKQLSQFHPSALMDSYATRTLNTQSANNNNYCPTQQAANGYDSRWRTLQQVDNSTTNKQSSLAGYYLVR